MEDSKFRNEAPELFSLEKKNIHQVPEGFFQELEKNIRQRRARNPNRFRKLKKWIELSAAASILGFVLFSGIKIISDKKYVPVETDRTFYNISDGDMDGEQVFNANN